MGSIKKQPKCVKYWNMLAIKGLYLDISDWFWLFGRSKYNIRNSLMSIADKILLKKRALIETVNDELKNIAQVEHSRHRSFNNFIANSLSAITAYCFFEKKPAIDVIFINDWQLVIF